jgi:long-chain acyl-CoA synthetase
VVDHFSFARALDEAKRMATHLQSMGFAPGSQVAILSKNCAHFILTDLAIWMAGYTSVALYPTLDEGTVKYILEHSEAKALFVGKLDEWDEMKGGVPDDMPKMSFPLSPPNDFPTWNDIIAESDAIAGEPVRAGDEMSIIIYTSGSTGQPKGVVHDFAGIAASAHGIIDALHITAEDRSLSYLPLAHAMERWAVECVSLVVGSRIFFAESLTTFVTDLKRARPTMFISVPRLWLKFQMGVFKKMPPKKLKRMLKIPILSGIVRRKVLANLGLDAVRFAGSGSAPIPADLIQWYRDLGLELLEGYGMSENFCYSHVSLPGKTRPGYVGHCYPAVQHRISEAGEILVKSPGDMKGYFKEPEMSAESFTEDGFLKTGDRGELDSEGRLKITGRVKELFKTSKGKYIAPAPIENIVNNDRHIELSCVSGSGYPMAYAVIQLGEDLLPDLAAKKAEIHAALEALLAKVNKEVVHHEQLAFIAVAKDRWTIEAGFLTPTMKIKRQKLEDTYNPQLDAWYDSKQKVVWEE